MKGGTSQDRFTLAQSGDLEKWKTIKIETAIPPAGKHTIGLLVYKAASPVYHALINAETLTFSYDSM